MMMMMMIMTLSLLLQQGEKGKVSSFIRPGFVGTRDLDPAALMSFSF